MIEPSKNIPPATPTDWARQLIRSADRAVLATSLGGWPYASLVLPALDGNGSPILLLSDLSEHAKNLKSEPRCSLLYDGSLGHADPLTAPRVTVLGEARELQDKWLLATFVGRHPSAALYANFGDFRLYRLSITRAHLVAGFGVIHWIDGPSLIGA
jgi:putative heme iron utilization protein